MKQKGQQGGKKRFKPSFVLPAGWLATLRDGRGSRYAKVRSFRLSLVLLFFPNFPRDCGRISCVRSNPLEGTVSHGINRFPGEVEEKRIK